MTIRNASSILVLSACIAVSTESASAVQTQTTSPIHVASCNPRPGYVAYPGFVPAYYPGYRYYWNDIYGYRYYQPPVATNPMLAIEYVNVSSAPAKEIEFGLVAHRELVAEVRDVGTFSPNATIKHEFGLNPNVFPLGTALARCVPLRVEFEDGSRWSNPHLPALRRSMYPH
jgi:hypothetical protein